MRCGAHRKTQHSTTQHRTALHSTAQHRPAQPNHICDAPTRGKRATSTFLASMAQDTQGMHEMCVYVHLRPNCTRYVRTSSQSTPPLRIFAPPSPSINFLLAQRW
ncbi:hypothetical protein ACMFMF_010180 [Clarireedia jacksonii]